MAPAAARRRWTLGARARRHVQRFINLYIYKVCIIIIIIIIIITTNRWPRPPAAAGRSAPRRADDVERCARARLFVMKSVHCGCHDGRCGIVQIAVVACQRARGNAGFAA